MNAPQIYTQAKQNLQCHTYRGMDLFLIILTLNTFQRYTQAGQNLHCHTYWGNAIVYSVDTLGLNFVKEGRTTYFT